MASFVTQPHVVDFVDVVMHDGTLEFRLEELTVSPSLAACGRTLRSVRRARPHRERWCSPSGAPTAASSPTRRPRLTIEAGDVLISVGTAEQLGSLAEFSA